MHDDFVRFVPSLSLRVLLYLHASFWFLSQALQSFSFKATNKNWTKNIIIIGYEQICIVGVGLGTFWHWVIYIYNSKSFVCWLLIRRKSKWCREALSQICQPDIWGRYQCSKSTHSLKTLYRRTYSVCLPTFCGTNSVHTLQKSFRWGYEPRPPVRICMQKGSHRLHLHVKDPVVHVRVRWIIIMEMPK